MFGPEGAWFLRTGDDIAAREPLAQADGKTDILHKYKHKNIIGE
jgi:hypothetical protein